jgi:hypothetical protein
MAEGRPRRVALPCSGGHKHPRDVFRVGRGGFSGQTGGVCPTRRGEGDGWTPRKMCFKIPIRLGKEPYAFMYTPIYWCDRMWPKYGY